MPHIDKKNNKDSKNNDKKKKKELDTMNVEISDEIGISKHSKKAKKTYK
ncbi:small, acid-soluble spore protein, alpha/beta type [Clostridium sp.]